MRPKQFVRAHSMKQEFLIIHTQWVRMSKKKGTVHWDTVNKKWRANIYPNKKHINLGRFITKLDAAKARWEAEKKYGYPNCNATSSAYQYIKESEKRVKT